MSTSIPRRPPKSGSSPVDYVASNGCTPQPSPPPPSIGHVLREGKIRGDGIKPPDDSPRPRVVPSPQQPLPPHVEPLRFKCDTSLMRGTITLTDAEVPDVRDADGNHVAWLTIRTVEGAVFRGSLTGQDAEQLRNALNRFISAAHGGGF